MYQVAEAGSDCTLAAYMRIARSEALLLPKLSRYLKRFENWSSGSRFGKRLTPNRNFCDEARDLPEMDLDGELGPALTSHLFAWVVASLANILPYTVHHKLRYHMPCIEIMSNLDLEEKRGAYSNGHRVTVPSKCRDDARSNSSRSTSYSSIIPQKLCASSSVEVLQDCFTLALPVVDNSLRRLYNHRNYSVSDYITASFTDSTS